MFSRIVSVGLALILIAAGVLKVFGHQPYFHSEYGLWANPWVRTGLAAWEVLLGVWLLSNQLRALAWVGAIGTFVVFAGASANLILLGRADCGCFGNIPTSPWVTLGIDVVAVALLLVTRPGWKSFTTTGQSPEQRRQFVRRAAVLLAGSAAVVGLLLAITVVVYGSPSTALARLIRKPLDVQTATIDLGELEPRQRVEANVSVTNRGATPVRFIGGRSDCSCLTTLDLPLTVEPEATATPRFVLIVPNADGGVFSRYVEFWTDSPDQPAVRVLVTGRIRAGGRSAD